jgi:hypothetical protein
MLYSPTMSQAETSGPQAAFAGVVRALRAWGVGGLAAELLESGGPLTFLGAQALYFAAPVIEPFGSGTRLLAWAELLEDPQAVNDLAGRLRGQASGQDGAL